MADYGVNIKVGVQNTQAITALTRKIKLTTSQVDQLNNFLENFNDWRLGPAVVNSVDNFNKVLKAAKDNLNRVALGNKEAADAARDFVRAQDLANDALREQAELLARIRNEGRSGTLRGGTQYGGPIGPGFGGFPATRPGDISVPAALRSPMRPQSLLPQFTTTVQAGKIASDMEDVYASILRLTEKTNQEESKRVGFLAQGTQELEEHVEKVKRYGERLKVAQQASAEFEDQAITKRDRRQTLLDRARAKQRLAADLKNQQAINQIEQKNIRDNAALELMRKKENEEALRKIRQRPIFTGSIGNALGSGLIGGAFPLLFGQGVGAAAGGTLGGLAGGAIGGQFGFALSLVGTQLGTVADQAVAFAAALDPLKPDFDVLKEKLGAVNNVTGELIDRYVALEEEENALALATEELTRLVGEDGVDALKQFGSDSEQLASTFAQAMTVMTVGLVKFIKESGALLGITDEINKKVLIAQASVSDDPALRSLVEERAQFRKTAKDFASPLPPFLAPLARALNLGDPDIVRGAQAGFARTEQQIIERQTAANARRRAELEERLSGLATPEQREAATKDAERAARQVEQTNKFIAGLERSLALTQAVSKLEQDRVAAQNKFERSMERVRDIQDDELRATAGYLVLQQYQADIRKAETAERERQEKIQDRVSTKEQKAAERLAKAADNELARADKAFNNANNQLDQIIQKHEDKMAFEREYAELIKTGSTPAAAKQAVQLQKELQDLDRKYKKLEEELKLRIKIAEAEIIKAEADPNADLDRIDGLRKKLKELQGDLAGLPGKKEDAEGAIAAALAPKSDRQRLLDYMTELQGQINEMMDPVRQLTALADTLGSAFGESFKGLVTGSMTAREALANLFQRTADHFLDMAAQMIAAQIKMQLLNIGLSFFGGAPAPSVLPGSAPPMTKDAIVTPTGFTGQFGGMAALGGSVTKGNSYIVGEKGPELFVPGAQGNIVPNNAMGGSNIVVNVDASGSNVEGSGQQAKALGQAIGAAVQAEIVKQKMPGGLLN